MYCVYVLFYISNFLLGNDHKKRQSHLITGLDKPFGLQEVGGPRF